MYHNPEILESLKKVEATRQERFAKNDRRREGCYLKGIPSRL